MSVTLSVTLRTGVRVWGALIQLEGDWGVPGFGGWLGGWLRVWVALIKLEGSPKFGVEIRLKGHDLRFRLK